MQAEEKLAVSYVRDMLPENTIVALPKEFINNMNDQSLDKPKGPFLSSFLADVMTVGHSPRIEMDDDTNWYLLKVVNAGRAKQFFID